MKIYLTFIKYIQEIFLAISISIMAILPIVLVFYPDTISTAINQNLYFISHIVLFFVMMVRPLADIFTETKWIRPLVILRKGTGVLSASIIIAFILAKLITDPLTYFANMGTWAYWSMTNYAVLAHMADISAVLLIITSNNLSKKIMGSGWKILQKLSYVYFFGSSLYVYLLYGNIELVVAMTMVSTVTFIAFIKNKERAKLQTI